MALLTFTFAKTQLMNIIRTFIAIEIPVSKNLLQRWDEVKTLLKDDRIRWVNDKTLHVTLFFLGDTPANLVDKIKHAVESSVQNTVPFELSLRGMGTFGDPNNPRVIWVGIDSCPPLIQLHNKVNTVVETFGYERDIRGFNPHITLGRVTKLTKQHSLKSYIEKIKQEPLLTHKVNGLTMYQSTLTPSGSIYKPLWKIELPLIADSNN